MCILLYVLGTLLLWIARKITRTLAEFMIMNNDVESCVLARVGQVIQLQQFCARKKKSEVWVEVGGNVCE
jgi:hypothetical protein